MNARRFATEIQSSIDQRDFEQARYLLVDWLRHWISELDVTPNRQSLRQPELWNALANYTNASGDQYLIEKFWQVLDRLPVPSIQLGERPSLPLMGIPILNDANQLEHLLSSIDYPVDILAIVDNSIVCCTDQPDEQSPLSSHLDRIKAQGHPQIKTIRIARPFCNLGVAASWNLILSSFPEVPCALIVNHDIRFPPGVLAGAMDLLDCRRPQFLSLLPPPHSFAAFLITCRCWDQIGLFDPNFHPAYCEDLDYRDRLAASVGLVDQVDGSFAYPAMAALNSSHSATIRSDPELSRHNQTSYALNRLWYLSDRRRRRDPRGCWRRLWLAQWSNAF